jgi:hypothetical protein
MARFNEIQRAGLNAILHKTLAMEEGAPAPQLSGDIVPVIVLESERPEWAFLAGEHLCQAGDTIGAGGVGTVAKCGVWNPVGSNALVTVTGFHVHTQTATRIQLRTAIAPLVSVAVGRIMDSRPDGFPVNGDSAARLQFENIAGFTGSVIDEYFTQVEIVLQVSMTAVLRPGSGIYLANNAENAYLGAGWTWRERPIEHSERR